MPNTIYPLSGKGFTAIARSWYKLSLSKIYIAFALVFATLAVQLLSIMYESLQCNNEQRMIASFVLLKLKTKNNETKDSALNFSKIAIDEFCMFGISNNQFETKSRNNIFSSNANKLVIGPIYK